MFYGPTKFTCPDFECFIISFDVEKLKNNIDNCNESLEMPLFLIEENIIILRDANSILKSVLCENFMWAILVSHLQKFTNNNRHIKGIAIEDYPGARVIISGEKETPVGTFIEFPHLLSYAKGK